MKVSLRQGKMRLGEVLVNLQGVGKLNCSFLVFALGAVPLTATEKAWSSKKLRDDSVASGCLRNQTGMH
jgi:hypothetical protein